MGLIYLISFIFGLLAGSFMNVLIYRLPKDESIVWPPSHCTSCGKNLVWYDNIPVLSYILLRAKCRYCKKPISLQYPIVELISAVTFVVFIYKFGLNFKACFYILLTLALVVASFIDLKLNVIPGVITVSGLIIGPLASFIYPALHGLKSHTQGLIASFSGMLLAGLSVYLMGILGRLLFKKEAMGWGDVELLAMVGSVLGARLVLVAFFLAPFLGLMPGIILKLRYKKEIIPYGPFISLASIISILWGDKIIAFIGYGF